jgi:polyisoprenyl-phosphate glycosyltransferase
MRKVSLIIPVFNEAELVRPFLKRVNAALRPLQSETFEFEFVFVNDGSSDSTLENLLHALRSDTRIRVIDLSRHFGKESALTAGLD